MAATIARASDPSVIANTMPTTKMSFGDATDGIDTAAFGDVLPRLRSAKKHVNSGTAEESVTVDVVLRPTLVLPVCGILLPNILNRLHL